ncbi:hypothetical protein D9M71_87630 [compost metagenome]
MNAQQQTSITIPTGLRQDAQGRLIPEALIKIEQEQQVLRRMGARLTLEDGRIAFAYGYDDRLFEIWLVGDHLVANIDRYSAICPEAHSSAFDPDKWAEQVIVLQAPCTRDGFRYLGQVCRALLAKRNVFLRCADGTWCLSMSGQTFIPREDDGRACPVFYPWEGHNHVAKHVNQGWRKSITAQPLDLIFH